MTTQARQLRHYNSLSFKDRNAQKEVARSIPVLKIFSMAELRITTRTSGLAEIRSR